MHMQSKDLLLRSRAHSGAATLFGYEILTLENHIWSLITCVAKCCLTLGCWLGLTGQGTLNDAIYISRPRPVGKFSILPSEQL